MQRDLNSRTQDDLAPVATVQLPAELLPVVHALNSLLDKVRIGAVAQQAFLANVAHQLRTPLAGLQMQIEWLQQHHADHPATAHSVRLMRLSAERMIRQTNQLLSLARAEPSSFEKARLEPVELDKLIEHSIQYFVEQADKKKIDLGFELVPTTVMGDQFLLRDMIDNLIDNAIRYSPDNSAVTVSCARTAEHATFVVADDGPGIAESERELIFNRFYRVDNTLTGSGLGLAIVRDIVIAHHAQIELSGGTGGSGTVFSVIFPVRPGADRPGI